MPKKLLECEKETREGCHSNSSCRIDDNQGDQGNRTSNYSCLHKGVELSEPVQHRGALPYVWIMVKIVHGISPFRMIIWTNNDGVRKGDIRLIESE